MIEDEEDQKLYNAMFPPNPHPDPRAERIAKAALDEFGFVTIATYDVLYVEEICTNVSNMEGHKMVVQGPATKQDWINQLELSYKLEPTYYFEYDHDVSSMHLDPMNFYKVVAK